MKKSCHKLIRELSTFLPGKWQVINPHTSVFFLLFLFMAVSASAQQPSVVTGNVTDTLGQPLQGVTVGTDNSKKNVVTDKDGNYSIAVTPSDKRLTFTFVGLKSVSQDLTGLSAYNISLTPDNTGLSDVVVSTLRLLRTI